MMHGDPRARTFLDRYYEWSIQEGLRELSRDFESVRAVQGTVAAESIRAISRFVPKARKDLTIALVKQRHQRELNAVEQELVARFKQYIYERYESRFAIESAAEERTLGDKRAIRKLVRKRGPSVLGEMHVDGGAVFHFALPVAGNKLMTFVDTGGRTRQLEYNHTIRFAGAAFPMSEVPINLMAWLGLSSLTTWDLIARGDEEQAVERLFEFSSRFVNAMPSLLGIHGP